MSTRSAAAQRIFYSFLEPQADMNNAAVAALTWALKRAQGVVVQDTSQSSSTVEVERAGADWRFHVVRDLVGRHNEVPAPKPDSLEWFVDWVFSCPPSLPTPDVAVGDDGSVVAEWDIGSRHFHVNFYGKESEGYYFDDHRELSIENLAASSPAVNRVFTRLLTSTLTYR